MDVRHKQAGMRDRQPFKFMFSLRNFTGLCSSSGLLTEPVSLGPGIPGKFDSARQSYTGKKRKKKELFSVATWRLRTKKSFQPVKSLFQGP